VRDGSKLAAGYRLLHALSELRHGALLVLSQSVREAGP
jgi:hypothetical protein